MNILHELDFIIISRQLNWWQWLQLRHILGEFLMEQCVFCVSIIDVFDVSNISHGQHVSVFCYKVNEKSCKSFTISLTLPSRYSDVFPTSLPRIERGPPLQAVCVSFYNQQARRLCVYLQWTIVEGLEPTLAHIVISDNRKFSLILLFKKEQPNKQIYV